MNGATLATIFVLAAAGVVIAQKTGVATMLIAPTVSTMTNGKISPQEVYSLAKKLIAVNDFNVSPEMATAIAIIESGDVSFPNNGCDPEANRFEGVLTDFSIGLMQTLSKTSQWLASDMGYTGAGDGSMKTLYDPATSMYFGLAYLDYLSKYKGAARDESFIVQSYNAGPVRASASYYSKYKKALQWVQQNLGD